MIPLKSDFRANAPLRLITADWLNTVANVLNNITIQFWEQDYAAIDRNSAGRWVIWLPNSSATSALGTKTLYKGTFLREYDSDGNLIEVGSETGGEDRQLLLTYDWGRAHE